MFSEARLPRSSAKQSASEKSLKKKAEPAWGSAFLRLDSDGVGEFRPLVALA